MFTNSDCTLYRCRPKEVQKELYRNAVCDEIIFVHHGHGKLYSHFGALPFIYGTVLTSFIALLISVPLGVGAAIFLAELAPPRLAATCTFLVELLAATSVESKRTLQILQVRGAAPDHPVAVTCPETQYLKCILARVE